MMPISEESGDAVASSQQLPTSPSSNLGRPLFSSELSVSLTPNWLRNASTRHRRSWQFKGRGSLCFLSSVLLIMSILPLIGKDIIHTWHTIKIIDFFMYFSPTSLLLFIALYFICITRYFPILFIPSYCGIYIYIYIFYDAYSRIQRSFNLP